MKKTLFAAAVFAAASVNSFGAACTTFNGNTLSSLGSCEIGNSGTLWTLSNFLVFNNTLNGFGVPDMTAANLRVNFEEIANGFSVTYSTQGGFAFTGTQANAWGNGMWITRIGAASPSNTVTDVDASYVVGSGDLNFTFRKNIQDQLGAGLGTALATFGSGTTNVNNATTSGSFGGALSVNDRVFFDAAGRSGGTITSYTNTFTTNNIPEPMSFLLMGAGLVGIAALRRRSS
ncbi:MAG: PEP-CTERM sorting domain-containing protein [Acidobacteria bacterium]|nr:PEP-CTERM sorting domain-containing protein [Acidobacteriota bacterium]